MMVSTDTVSSCTQGQGRPGKLLTGHDDNPPIRIWRSDGPQQWQRKVGRNVQETPNPEHLEMVEFTQRWTKSGVEVELVEKLTDAHHRDEE